MFWFCPNQPGLPWVLIITSPDVNVSKTRLTYNCAHLRWTKESLTFEYDGTGSVEGGTGWYLVELGQYRVVLVDIWWYWVINRAFMPICIEKSGDSDGCYHIGTDRQTNKRTRKDRATQPMDCGRLRWAKIKDWQTHMKQTIVWPVGFW